MVHDGTRTRALSVLIALLATATLVHGQGPKQMAITFDDLPFGYARNLTIAEQREAVTRVLATLDKHRVTATVFVVGRTVTDANRGLVDAFVQAGHVVGSHSFSHLVHHIRTGVEGRGVPSEVRLCRRAGRRTP
jgi:peptidoglycan/xylan/chitin deacetylase (PgdA/CDA1 family)